MRFVTFAALALVTMFAVSGCATQCSENFYALRDGMTKESVRELLGKPSSTWPEEGGLERWQYGDSLSSLATTSVFKQADTARVWAVWFDSEGHVTSFIEPEWKSTR